MQRLLFLLATMLLLIPVSANAQLLPTTTTTVVHNLTHQVVTTVGADDPVHPLVTVVGQPGNPTPTGRVIVEYFQNRTCVGLAGSSQPTLNANSNGIVDLADQFSLTVGRVGFMGFRTRYIGDALYAPSESPCVAVESISESACPNIGRPRLAFDPVSPDSSQIITFTVGVPEYFRTPEIGATVATLQGNTITVTLSAARFNVGLPPPLQCTTALIGPLLPGVYAVQLLLGDLSRSPPSGPVLVTTTTLIVAPQQVATVPTLSEYALAALAALLAVGAFFGLRHSQVL